MTEIKMDLENIKSISFTFDLWSSQAQQSYISLTCHYLTNKFKLKNKTLCCSYFPGEHTGNAIYNKIKNMVAEWNIEIENSDSNISIFLLLIILEIYPVPLVTMEVTLNTFYVQHILFSWQLMML